MSNTALPYEYEVYATYETSGNLEDLKFHELIDTLNSELRVVKNREFYLMSPQEAYKLLESIAYISGTLDRLHIANPEALEKNKQNVKKPRIDFYECGLKDGEVLEFIEDPSVKVVICGKNKVMYNNVMRSLTDIVREI